MRPPGEERALYALVAGLLALVLFVDLRVLPLGIPAWSLYVIPVVACLYAWRPSVPLVVGLVAAVLEGAGYFLKPLPDVPEILRTAQINRGMGFATLLLLGVTLRQFVAARVRAAEQNWVKTGENLLVARLQAEQGVAELGKGALAFLADYVNAPVGAAWFEDGAGRFRRAAGFAHPVPDDASATVKAGEGLQFGSSKNQGIGPARRYFGEPVHRQCRSRENGFGIDSRLPQIGSGPRQAQRFRTLPEQGAGCPGARRG